MTFKNTIVKAFEEFFEEYFDDHKLRYIEYDLTDLKDKIDVLETSLGDLEDVVNEIKEKVGI